jgi:peptide/nickel transport system substrate-binding protein
LGVALDADFLFFNLRPDAMAGDPRRAWLQADEFRRAVSQAVDRRSFADTVFLGLGEPVYGPVTRGNHQWYEPAVEKYDFDLAQSRTRLDALGLTDADGDGTLEDRDGQPVRFTLLTQQGNSVRERAAAVLEQDLARVGSGVDVVHLEFGALVERITTMNFDAVYLGFQTSDTDPALNLDLWLSSAAFHFWNPSQPTPATDWERRIDELMYEQISTQEHTARKRLFGEVQQIFSEYVPALYFAAPRVYIATSARVANATPALLEPFVLWSADTLATRSHLD